MPIRCDTPWGQPMTTAHAYGQIALPPAHAEAVGKIEFRLTDLEGLELGVFEAQRETIEKQGDFQKAVAHWPSDLAPPGQHQVTAIVYDREGKVLSRVAPRLVSVNMQIGY